MQSVIWCGWYINLALMRFAAGAGAEDERKDDAKNSKSDKDQEPNRAEHKDSRECSICTIVGDCLGDLHSAEGWQAL